MRILVLITARGGSKRLSGKNICVLGEKPLIAWSIDVATDIPEICDILVSTDDTAIASVCTEAGALVPWRRPAELATDGLTKVNRPLGIYVFASSADSLRASKRAVYSK